MFTPEEQERIDPFLEKLTSELGMFFGRDGPVRKVINEAKEAGVIIQPKLLLELGIFLATHSETREPESLVEKDGSLKPGTIDVQDRKLLKALKISIKDPPAPKSD